MAERNNSLMQTRPKFTELNDLCSERNGGAVLFATDDWFAVAENLIKVEEPQWHEGEFTKCGKWMDGWETRRRRIPGHDWAILKLGVPGVVHGFTIDTAFFTGNYTPRFSLQAAYLQPKDETCIPHRRSDIGQAATITMMKQIGKLESEKWAELVPMLPLMSGYWDTRYNYFAIKSREVWSHVRLNMYPDGGIARLRLYGEAKIDWSNISSNELVDLISMFNGGVCVSYSDAHFGHPRNIISRGTGVNMGDGWETARRLDRPCILEADDNGILKVPGSEWAIFRLGHIGSIDHIEVDTNHFKGNFPDTIYIEGMLLKSGEDWDTVVKDIKCWKSILTSKKLLPHKLHNYTGCDLQTTGPFSHIRVTIAPDGGISRLRLWGYCEHIEF